MQVSERQDTAFIVGDLLVVGLQADTTWRVSHVPHCPDHNLTAGWCACPCPSGCLASTLLLCRASQEAHPRKAALTAMMPAAAHPQMAKRPLPRAWAAMLLLHLPSSWPLGLLWMSSKRMKSMALATCHQDIPFTVLRYASCSSDMDIDQHSS